jgi:DNA-binding beta-propeller fold protein YncE
VKLLLRITVLFLFTCLAAGPGQAADSKSTSPAPPAASNINLLPLRVVYQQVEGVFLKSPRGVWVDKAKGDVYVADTLNDLVAVYDSAGLPVFSFGYNRELKEPVKAVADATGRIYVLNGIPRAVKIFNYRGEYLNDFPLNVGTKERNPTALAIDQLGNFYIADANSRQIQVYNPQFRLIREFGKKSDDDGYFNTVQAIAIDADGTVYVADATATPCIQVFSPEGKFLRGWGAHDAGPHNFSLPAGLALDGDGRVIVVDTMRSTITVFTKEGDFLSRHGGQGRQPGAVSYPTDIASNGREKIYVVERLGSRLQVFEEKAALVRRNASPPSASNPIREQIQRELGGFLKGMK